MTQIKKIFLNGEKYSTNQNLTLFDLLVYFNYDNYLLVLEYNNLILDKTKWKTTFIKNCDKIEIVTIVGGG
uniref:Thiamine biosynthesis protein n=1 Tax=Nitzschia ovalis TaxID=908985 RepID=UPI001EF9F4DE|nr:Thiamine biosynthesis protein [Nitzschia ovalis]ULD15754.1 Thiamine biosynthesis protein [Nitzschia ovalis]